MHRFLLKAREACSVSLDLRTCGPALQACSRLLLVDAASGRACTHVLNRPCSLPLEAHSSHTLLALAEPHADVPPSSWALSVTSSSPLPPLQDVPVTRTVLQEGVYATNTHALLAR